MVKKRSDFRRRKSKPKPPHGLNSEWKRFRAAMLSKRRLEAAERDEAPCAECSRTGMGFRAQSDLELHHKIPRRFRPDLTYEETNVEFLCKQHHLDTINREIKMVIPGRYVVTGRPGAGKTTYVRAHARAGDMVWDSDDVARAKGWGEFPRSKPAAQALKNLRSDWLTRAVRHTEGVWCIVTHEEEAKRVAQFLAARLVFCKKVGGEYKVGQES